MQRINEAATLVVFIDELNTAGAFGAVAETMGSGCLDGVPLPPNVLFVAAINPPHAAGEEMAERGVGDFRFTSHAAALAEGPAASASAASAAAAAAAARGGGGAGATGGAAAVAREADPDNPQPEDERLEEYMPSFVVKPVPLCLERLVTVHQGVCRARE